MPTATDANELSNDAAVVAAARSEHKRRNYT